MGFRFFSSKVPMSVVETDSCFKLIKSVWLNESKGKNFVFSPYSINAALGLLASGSSGRTLEQLLGFFECKTLSHVHSVHSRAIESLEKARVRSNGVGGGGPKVSFASSVWIDKSCAPKPSFVEVASSIYKAEVTAVDFKTKANDVLEEVNKWVEKETNGLFQNLLPPRSFRELTRLVLVNVLYFKGSWEKKFNRSETEDSEFYLLNGSAVQVPFMTNNKKQIVSCYDGFKVLKLPYKQDTNNDPHQKNVPYSMTNMFDRFQKHLSMYIFLPDKRDGLGDLLEKVNSDSGFVDRHLPMDQPAIKLHKFKIPKFKITFEFKELKRVLEELGLDLPFNPQEAELTEMVNSGIERLYVSEAYHKCFLEVDEEGTEATAATVLLLRCSCGPNQPRPPPISFVADHPFMFMVRDDHSGAVWFMGHVINPLLTD